MGYVWKEGSLSKQSYSGDNLHIPSSGLTVFEPFHRFPLTAFPFVSVHHQPPTQSLSTNVIFCMNTALTLLIVNSWGLVYAWSGTLGTHTPVLSQYMLSTWWFNVQNVRANCLATNTEYCNRCTHTATQATNVAWTKIKGTEGLLTVSGGWVRVQ
jgi:hypothetical protein